VDKAGRNELAEVRDVVGRLYDIRLLRLARRDVEPHYLMPVSRQPADGGFDEQTARACNKHLHGHFT
jgi:hypothetical protein